MRSDIDSDSDESQQSWETNKICQDSSETNDDSISEDSDSQQPTTGADKKGGKFGLTSYKKHHSGNPKK